jgi:hypothetical protein
MRKSFQITLLMGLCLALFSWGTFIGGTIKDIDDARVKVINDATKIIGSKDSAIQNYAPSHKPRTDTKYREGQCISVFVDDEFYPSTNIYYVQKVGYVHYLLLNHSKYYNIFRSDDHMTLDIKYVDENLNIKFAECPKDSRVE